MEEKEVEGGRGSRRERKSIESMRRIFALARSSACLACPYGCLLLGRHFLVL